MERLLFEVDLPKHRFAKSELDKAEPKAKDKVKKENFFTISLRDIDETVWSMAKSLADAGKDLECTKMVLKELHSGGDNIDEVLNNFTAVNSARIIVTELVSPLDVELKKK